MLRNIKRLALAFVLTVGSVSPAVAQVTATQLSPINVSVAYAGQVPANAAGDEACLIHKFCSVRLTVCGRWFIRGMGTRHPVKVEIAGSKPA